MPRLMPISMPKRLKKRIAFDEIISLYPTRRVGHGVFSQYTDSAFLEEMESMNPLPVKLYPGNILNPNLDNGMNGQIFQTYRALRISFVPFLLVEPKAKKVKDDLQLFMDQGKHLRGVPAPYNFDPPVPVPRLHGITDTNNSIWDEDEEEENGDLQNV